MKPMSYDHIKAKHPDALILFRCGDFYESYEQDAEEVAEICGITLIKRKDGRFCGFPYHALDSYLPKIIRAGKRVCICDTPEPEQVKRHTMKRTEIEKLYKAFDDFIADCNATEVGDNKDAIAAIKTLMHQRMRYAE